MHHEMTDYASQNLDRSQVYEAGITGVPQVEQFPVSAGVSQQGDNYSMRSTPSPSPPSGAQGNSNSRSRTKSGTQHLTMQQLNKKRQRATPEQLQILEEYFSLNASPNAKMREIIADRIQMTERSVQIWFQNRRAKVKQIQRREMNGEEIPMFYPGLGGSPGMMKPNVLMRSNSLGHGGYSHLSPEMKTYLRMGYGNSPLTPAASPSSKTVISRLSIETLSIGGWHRVACSSMDLVVYYSPMEGHFTYYINNSSTGFKIEFPITSIRKIRMEHMVRKLNTENSVPGREEAKHRARIMIDLTQPPLFYSEQRGAGGWVLCHDFTQGLVASTILLHTLVGPYQAILKELSELAAMSPELNARLWLDEQPQYLSFDEDEHSAVTTDRTRRHSAMAAPPRPASAIPSQYGRSHLTPVPVFNQSLGAPRVRQSFQAHRRTRSRSLPNAINVSELAALAASHSIGSNLVPGMKYPEPTPQYVPISATGELMYNPIPLRIDTSVADSSLDYYRQFTPSSNISSQMTPVDYASPVSHLPSSLPFYEGSEHYPVSAGGYGHTALYSSEGLEGQGIYGEDVHHPVMMGVDHFHPQEAYTYAGEVQESGHYAAVPTEQWQTQPPPQVTVTSSQLEVEPKAPEAELAKPITDSADAKMQGVE